MGGRRGGRYHTDGETNVHTTYEGQAVRRSGRRMAREAVSFDFVHQYGYRPSNERVDPRHWNPNRHSAASEAEPPASTRAGPRSHAAPNERGRTTERSREESVIAPRVPRSVRATRPGSGSPRGVPDPAPTGRPRRSRRSSRRRGSRSRSRNSSVPSPRSAGRR